MASLSPKEDLCPQKKQKLGKKWGSFAGKTISPDKLPNPNVSIQYFDPNDDECIRQYILYYYQFQRSEGFDIDWDELEYQFEVIPILEPYRYGSETNDEHIRDVASRAISQHNEEKGTRLEFVDHISASYKWVAVVLYWITFRARDLASSNSEPKIYQTKCRRCGPTLFEVYIFRIKPTDEEIAAVQVAPPPPLYVDDPDEPTILFTVKGPGSGFIPDVSFIRIPPEVDVSSTQIVAEAENESSLNS